MIKNCIQESNPGAGFLLSHRRFCSRCDEDATHHKNHDGAYCENVCKKHAGVKNGTLPEGVEAGVFVNETARNPQ